MELHKANIKDVQTHTLTLIKSFQQLIKDFHATKVACENTRGFLSPDKLNETKEQLENEFQKAKDLKTVIAVVGTMKAGKSTTINAIVGQEILPNRNYPMTALPTVVTHVPGKSTPELTLRKTQPLVDLSQKLASTINGLSREQLERADFLHHKEAEGLLNMLRKQGQICFDQAYSGQAEIFAFLKELNDLMRLAKELDVEPPYGEYRLIHDLPTIEVAFHHLNAVRSEQPGKLSLLDTPGPNEFGQSATLKRVFEDQLQLASAVLLVVDYTQMNSEAGGKVREEVSRIRSSLEGHVYVMLNKFDAQQKNDQSKEDTVDYFCKQLMDGKVSAEHVFPVSAYQAFLANHALNELDIKGKLDLRDSWIEAFGEEAFGKRWQNKISDGEEVRAVAKDVWNDSLFAPPLDRVVGEAFRNAALLSLRHAIDVLKTFLGDMEDGLSGFQNALSTDISTLGEIITGIETDQQEILTITNQAKQQLRDSADQLKSEILNYANEEATKADNEVKLFLDTGQSTQQAEAKARTNRERESKKEEKTTISVFKIISDLFSSDDRAKPIEKALADNSVIVYKEDQKKEAEELLKGINAVLSKVQEEVGKNINEMCDKRIAETESILNEKIDTLLGKVLDRAREILVGEGFSISFSFDRLSTSRSGSSAAYLIADTAQASKREVTRRRVKDSWWGKLTNMLNDDWGRESYTSHETVYRIDIPAIKRAAGAAMQSYTRHISEEAQSYIENDVAAKIHYRIEVLANYLENYRQTLFESLRANRQSIDEKERLSTELSQFISPLTLLKEDASDAAQELTLVSKDVATQAQVTS